MAGYYITAKQPEKDWGLHESHLLLLNYPYILETKYEQIKTYL